MCVHAFGTKYFGSVYPYPRNHAFREIIQHYYTQKRNTLFGFNINVNVEEGLVNGSFGMIYKITFNNDYYWMSGSRIMKIEDVQYGNIVVFLAKCIVLKNVCFV